MEEDEICRVCRSSGTIEKPLSHPCMCMGSIRFVHQECLVEWLHHSKKEHCELCNHKYTFKPIYSPDMPNYLPFYDLILGLLKNIWSVISQWFFSSVIITVWFAIVPLTASRIYRCVFAGSVSSLTSFPKNMLSTDNLMNDIVHGYLVASCTLSAFFILLWLKTRILNGELPEWMIHRPHNEIPQVNNERNQNNEFENNEGPALIPDINNAPGEAPNPAMFQVQNLNDVDWDFARREIQFWERVLGRNGVLPFIELVFWVVAIITLFILVFAFCPYHLGHFFMLSLDLNFYIEATKFEGFLTGLCGYALIACGFLFSHIALQITKFHWPGWICGVCYIVVKVAMLAIIELVLLPLVCGIWLDICTLKAFNSTIENRQEGYSKTPTFSIIVHWFIGIVFVFYFTAFLKLLKEALRPGILWFMRSINDPNYSPINEMIHLSMIQQIRQFLLTIVILGFTIIAIAWLPVQLLLLSFPNIFPFSSTFNSTVPIGEFPFQLLLLQLTIPGMLEHNNFKDCVIVIIRGWANVFGTMLRLKSYLLGDDNAIFFVGNQWNAQQPYVKPSFFLIRIIILMLFFTGTLTTVIAALFSLPIMVGRATINVLFGNALLSFNRIHDIHAFLIGLHIFWMIARIYGVIFTLLPRGWTSIKAKIIESLIVFFKFITLFSFMILLIPLLLGLLVDLIILIPYKVSSHQSPVVVLLLDWIYGAFFMKFFVVVVLVGPDTWLRRDFVRAHRQGLLRLQLLDFITKTIMPVIYGLLTCICAPYVFGRVIPLLWECDPKTENFFKLQTHVYLLSISGVLGFCWYEINHIDRLYDHIKNERYMIGRRLEDYEPTVATA